MEAVFLVVHLIVAVSIVIMVLLQPAESNGFMGSGGNSMPAPRRAADTLTRITTILGGVFFVTSLSLGIFAQVKSNNVSILDSVESSSAVETSVKKDAVNKKEPAKKEKPTAPISE